ncbi:hypothetical protein AXX12_02315 [Anaerosporomusa subterranea]|uniref:ECF transporter S component n=1 Tax=Anaerosporomusa subterranea TaxID=1794912 RepID=A0A154BU02_ANASB|nr:hypothetical protein [Anaerosporomusa subterranea]KYZ76998.1 hypothetical protein AXX12_02315 [Anaerosporomusa subterranea]
MSKQTILTRTALLLAITLIFQSLRFFIPIPPLFSTFLVGSLVNATLLISLNAVGLLPTLFLAVIAPLVAYFQQLLLLPIFILPVAAGNMVYVGVFFLLSARGTMFAAATAASGKTLLLYLTFSWLLSWVSIPPKIASGLLFVMSWPQLVTALAGAALASIISRRLRNS